MAQKKKESKGKKEKKPKKPTQLWTKYEVKGSEVSRKNQTCPKCGPSYFLAAHKDRVSCGKCNYTEFKSKKA